MSQPVPLNPEVLRWARETSGLTVEAVASKLGRKTIDAQTVSEWETGNGAPTYPQLEALAHDIFKRPVAIFFFPVIPKEETPKSEFRTLPEVLVDGLPPQMVNLYRKAKILQMNLEELYEGERPVGAPLLESLRIDETSDVVSLTQALRQKLGVTIEEQSQWRSTETAFKKWREALDSCGIFVFKDAFKNDDYSGFCLWDQTYPLIYVNNSMRPSRQVFTLFHELGHLLHRSGGIDFRSRDFLSLYHGHLRDIEVSCNRFANEFLVPRAVFDAFPRRVSEADIKALSDHFSVSREVILRNYLDRGVVDAAYYDEMVAKWTAQAKAVRERAREDKEGRGNYYYNMRAYLGDRYIEAVFRKHYQSQISIETVADYLHLNVRKVSKFEHVVMEGGKP